MKLGVANLILIVEEHVILANLVHADLNKDKVLHFIPRPKIYTFQWLSLVGQDLIVVTYYVF
jgi:hypothetical protein